MLWAKNDKSYEPKLALVGSVATFLATFFTTFTIVELEQYEKYRAVYDENANMKSKNSYLVFNPSPIQFDLETKSGTLQQTVPIGAEALNGEFVVDSISLLRYDFNKGEEFIFKSEYNIKPKLKLVTINGAQKVLRPDTSKKEILLTFEPYVLLTTPYDYISFEKNSKEQKKIIGSAIIEISYTDLTINFSKSKEVEIPIILNYKK